MSGTARRTLWALLALSVLHGGFRGPTQTLGQTPDSTSIVRGQVLEHETGTPLRGAAVSLTSLSDGSVEPRTQSSGESGDFRFEAVPPGVYRLEVSLLGFHNLRNTQRITARSELYLTLPLSVSPIRLEPIVVISTRDRPGPMMGFETRRQRTSGVFFTREQIEGSASFEFTDLIRRIPGIRIVTSTRYGKQVTFRGGCNPDLWVDGTLAGSTLELDSFIRIGDLEGVEVYQGAELPIEFGSNLCGAIVVWTRRGRATTEERSLKTQLIFVGSFVVLALFGLFVGR